MVLAGGEASLGGQYKEASLGLQQPLGFVGKGLSAGSPVSSIPDAPMTVHSKYRYAGCRGGRPEALQSPVHVDVRVYWWWQPRGHSES